MKAVSRWLIRLLPFFRVILPLKTYQKTHHRGMPYPAYQKEMRHNAPQMSDWQKYKDDQLLSNPGGDGYYLKEKRVISDPEDQESFWGEDRARTFRIPSTT